MTRTNKVLWMIQILLALLFLFAGGMKLLVPLETLARQSPLPAPFLKFIGIAEVLGAIGLIAATRTFETWAFGAVLLGAGTAMVYPTLLAAIGDVAHPSWRASSVGVYRFWRDLGYAVGALLAGLAADALGLSGAMWLVAALTFASGLVAALRMSETLPQRSTPWPLPAR